MHRLIFSCTAPPRGLGICICSYPHRLHRLALLRMHRLTSVRMLKFCTGSHEHRCTGSPRMVKFSTGSCCAESHINIIFTDSPNHVHASYVGSLAPWPPSPIPLPRRTGSPLPTSADEGMVQSQKVPVPAESLVQYRSLVQNVKIGTAGWLCSSMQCKCSHRLQQRPDNGAELMSSNSDLRSSVLELKVQGF